jgi:hypothetical protein
MRRVPQLVARRHRPRPSHRPSSRRRRERGLDVRGMGAGGGGEGNRRPRPRMSPLGGVRVRQLVALEWEPFVDHRPGARTRKDPSPGSRPYVDRRLVGRRLVHRVSDAGAGAELRGARHPRRRNSTTAGELLEPQGERLLPRRRCQPAPRPGGPPARALRSLRPGCDLDPAQGRRSRGGVARPAIPAGIDPRLDLHQAPGLTRRRRPARLTAREPREPCSGAFGFRADAGARTCPHAAELGHLLPLLDARGPAIR